MAVKHGVGGVDASELGTWNLFPAVFLVHFAWLLGL